MKLFCTLISVSFLFDIFGPCPGTAVLAYSAYTSAASRKRCEGGVREISGWCRGCACHADTCADTELLATTRRNLPVTIQRRFDVYADVSAVQP
jgi:hypothetical protein